MTKTLKVIMADCDPNADGQKWKLENLKPEKLKDFY